MSDDVKLVWSGLLQELSCLCSLRVPRFVFSLDSSGVNQFQLHGFCDSSQRAYCGAVYIREKSSVGVSVKLLAAKTKVTPLKELSIPRLELLGCVLLSELIRDISVAFETRFKFDVFCWTDSEVALCWLKGNLKCWRPWVENRVVKVRKIVKKERWNHVSGKLNPADIATRLKAFDSVLEKPWFCGPEFLYDTDFEVGEFDVERKLQMVDVLRESKKVAKVKKKSGFEERVESSRAGDELMSCLMFY